jgi:hypothetical protein
MVTAASVNSNMNTVPYTITMGGQDKVYVPVRPVNVVYTQLDHVAGVPAKGNQSGVTVSKAQILNSLIDQLVTMNAAPKISSTKDRPLTVEEIEALITDFKHRLEEAIQTAQTTGYGLSGAAPQPGALFSIVA